MEKTIRLGIGPDCDIQVGQTKEHHVIAEITYQRGYWVLKNLDQSKSIIVNDEFLSGTRNFDKYDNITIDNKTINWSNYLYEGDEQELNLKDLRTFDGRVSRSNYRALSLMFLGLAIAVIFLPGLLVALWESKSRNRLQSATETIETMRAIGPFIHTVGFFLLASLLVLISIKRIRDVGKPIWTLIIPVYNLKVLFFDPSHK